MPGFHLVSFGRDDRVHKLGPFSARLVGMNNSVTLGHLLASGNPAAIAIAIETIRAHVQAQGTLTAAAKALGVPVRTMFRWIAKHPELGQAVSATRMTRKS